MWEVAVGLLAVGLIVGLGFLFARLITRKDPKFLDAEAQRVLFLAIQEKIERIPDITISKVVGKTNVDRGAFGEMVSFLRLKAEYDKVIPFHDVVDFIGIRFGKEGKDGAIDFIDIKTGGARLTREQQALRNLIKEKKVNFLKVHLTIDDCVNKDNTDAD
jgi:predicted Holliday junction resolvase-like endonuclease